MRRPISLCIALGCLSLAPTALAQDIVSLPAGASSPPDTRTDIGPDVPYWSAGPSRWFAAVVFESAGIALRTELDLGYGKPHYKWIGLQADSGLSLRGISTFGGVRGVMPWGSLRFGPRFWTALTQKLLPEVDSVTREMLDVDEGLRSRYLSLEAEASAQIPVPYGSIGLLFTGFGLFGIEEGHYVFEDSLRVVVDPPLVGRFRVTYLSSTGPPGTLRVGGLAELIYNPGREMVNVRLGPAVAVSLTHHLSAIAAVALSVYNPDNLGIAGADVGQIGLRYQWATGDLWPEFP